MWESKAREILCSRVEAQAQDHLLRYYGKIGPAAVAAALDAGAQKAPRERAEKAPEEKAAPAFLFAEDRAA
jgi:hypothetical protein